MSYDVNSDGFKRAVAALTVTPEQAAQRLIRAAQSKP